MSSGVRKTDEPRSQRNSAAYRSAKAARQRVFAGHTIYYLALKSEV